MSLGSGAIAQAVLPLCIAAAGTGVAAQIALLQARAESTYDNARYEVRSSLHLDWQPQTYDEHSAGEIACWRPSDASVRETAIHTDAQGNLYVLDGAQLRVLKFEPGFKLERTADDDWMSSRIADEAEPTGSLH